MVNIITLFLLIFNSSIKLHKVLEALSLSLSCFLFRFPAILTASIDIDTGFSETTMHTGEGLDRSDKAGYKATTGALKRFLSSTFLS